MKTCGVCGSIISGDTCTNVHCGKPAEIHWAKRCKKYEEDLNLGNELIFKTSAMEAQHGYEKFHHPYEW